MYCEFLYVILNYFLTLNKKEQRFEVWMPVIIGIASLIYCVLVDEIIQYVFIKDIIPFLGTLLGLTLAALTLLLSNGQMEQRTRNYDTQRTIRGKKVSLYQLIVVSYSYIIIVETILCVLFYIASLFPNVGGDIYNLIANTVFIIGVFNALFATIRTVTNLYFVTVK